MYVSFEPICTRGPIGRRTTTTTTTTVKEGPGKSDFRFRCCELTLPRNRKSEYEDPMTPNLCVSGWIRKDIHTVGWLVVVV